VKLPLDARLAQSCRAQRSPPRDYALGSSARATTATAAASAQRPQQDEAGNGHGNGNGADFVANTAASRLRAEPRAELNSD
jgi:hypothetical protein